MSLACLKSRFRTFRNSLELLRPASVAEAVSIRLRLNQIPRLFLVAVALLIDVMAFPRLGPAWEMADFSEPVPAGTIVIKHHGTQIVLCRRQGKRHSLSNCRSEERERMVWRRDSECEIRQSGLGFATVRQGRSLGIAGLYPWRRAGQSDGRLRH